MVIVVLVGGLVSFVLLLRELLLCIASMFALVLIEFVHLFLELSCFMELSEELDSTLHGFEMTAAGFLHFDVPVVFRWGSLEQDAYLFFFI